MDDAAPVGEVHGLGQHLNHLGRVLHRLRRAVDLALKAAAVDVLHGQVRAAVLLAHRINLDNVSVLQLGNGLRLGAETRQLELTRMAARQDHFQGDGAFETFLAGLVNHAHGASAQYAQDLVTGDLVLVACIRHARRIGQVKVGAVNIRGLDGWHRGGAGPWD
jgi:hypothetical protein